MRCYLSWMPKTIVFRLFLKSNLLVDWNSHISLVFTQRWKNPGWVICVLLEFCRFKVTTMNWTGFSLILELLSNFLLYFLHNIVNFIITSFRLIIRFVSSLTLQQNIRFLSFRGIILTSKIVSLSIRSLKR